MIPPADSSIFDPVVKLVNSKMTWCYVGSLPCPSHGQDDCCSQGMMIIIAWVGIRWEQQTNIIINYKVRIVGIRGMDVPCMQCCCCCCCDHICLAIVVIIDLFFDCTSHLVTHLLHYILTFLLIKLTCQLFLLIHPTIIFVVSLACRPRESCVLSGG